ncbi:hypothetical protein IFR05_007455 [Cadophora sp. M221]|nr:hypothetical protein IFR05_007455 [Cadophora sp. M221]
MPPSPPPASHSTLPPTNPTPLTECERSGLIHWSLYGRGHDPSVQDLKPRALPPKNPKKISKPVFSHWNVPLSAEQMGRLWKGFVAEEMEDKWLVYSVDGEKGKEKEGGFEIEGAGRVELKLDKREGGEGGDEGDDRKQVGSKESEMMRVFMVRSWTGNLIYEIQILVLRDVNSKKGEEGEVEVEGRIEGLVWESDEENIRGQDEAFAKESVREVCRWILGVQLLPDVPKPRRGGGSNGSGKE